MNRELRVLMKTILLVQSLSGSKLSKPALKDAPDSINEVFDLLAEIIQSRNNTNSLLLEPVLEKVEYLVFRDDISATLQKWSDEIETFGVPTDIESFPYEYEEFENIYDAIFFSELELLAKEAGVVDKRLENILIVFSILLLGYAVGVTNFAEKAAFILGIKTVLKGIPSGNALTNVNIPPDTLSLFERNTAQFIYKTLTAAGSTAQSIESEDLEGGVPTRLNLLQHEGYKKKKKKTIRKVEKDELRNLLTKS